jgi:lysophospholipase L1-like esterase
MPAASSTSVRRPISSGMSGKCVGYGNAKDANAVVITYCTARAGTGLGRFRDDTAYVPGRDAIAVPLRISAAFRHSTMRNGTRMRGKTRRLLPLLLAPVSVLGAVAYAAPATGRAAAGAAVVSGTTYTVTNVNSGLLMDVSGAVTDPGGKVIQWPSNGGANQEWTITQAGSGVYTLASAKSGLCLEAPDTGWTTQADQNTCTGATKQQWQLQLQSDGSYTLANVASGLMADVSGGLKDQGTPVIGWGANGGLNQRWNLTPLTRVGTWTAGFMGSGPSFSNQTIRMVTHATVAGSLARVKLSNLYGTAPLTVDATDLAVQSSNGSAVSGTHHAVTFNGSAGVTVPAGTDVFSDPVPMQVAADQDLLVSIFLQNQTGPSTWHPLYAVDTTYASTPGNHVAEDSTANYPSANNTGSWFFVAGVDVISPTASGTVVAIGDSITEGRYTTVGANRRWSDDLARRLNAASGGTTRGVVNAGIGGNRLMTDTSIYGASLLHRFAHDALGQPGVNTVIVLEGINDLGANAGLNGGPVTAQDMENSYQTLINQAHAQGVRIYGATILPAGWSQAVYAEQIREAVNQWIRTSGAFDAVIDMDAATRSSTNPLTLNTLYNSGDGLHPNDAGAQAMANAVNLALLTP